MLPDRKDNQTIPDNRFQYLPFSMIFYGQRY